MLVQVVEDQQAMLYTLVKMGVVNVIAVQEMVMTIMETDVVNAVIKVGLLVLLVMEWAMFLVN